MYSLPTMYVYHVYTVHCNGIYTDIVKFKQKMANTLDILTTFPFRLSTGQSELDQCLFRFVTMVSGE
jgi:hypothetical protein